MPVALSLINVSCCWLVSLVCSLGSYLLTKPLGVRSTEPSRNLSSNWPQSFGGCVHWVLPNRGESADCWHNTHYAALLATVNINPAACFFFFPSQEKLNYAVANSAPPAISWVLLFVCFRMNHFGVYLSFCFNSTPSIIGNEDVPSWTCQDGI